MSSNLPPGVTDAMLPGNRPEDLAWERFWDYAQDRLSTLDISEAYMALDIGTASIAAIRSNISSLIEEARQDERISIEMRRRK